jgi:hypothetical protein
MNTARRLRLRERQSSARAFASAFRVSVACVCSKQCMLARLFVFEFITKLRRAGGRVEYTSGVCAWNGIIIIFLFPFAHRSFSNEGSLSFYGLSFRARACLSVIAPQTDGCRRVFLRETVSDSHACRILSHWFAHADLHSWCVGANILRVGPQAKF